MSEQIVLDVEIKSPIEKVWKAITDSSTMSQWMMFKTNDFKPEVGHAFQLKDAPGYDGVIQCEITEMDEPNKLAYTWSTVGVQDAAHNSVVTFELSSVESGETLVHLTQSGFRPDAKQEFAGAKYGWQFMLGELDKVLTA